MTGDPGVDEELVLVDQIQPVQFGCKLAATEEHTGRGRILQFLHARAQIAADVVAVGPREVSSRRRHHVFRLGFQLDRPIKYRRRRLLVAASDRRPVALHHLVGNAAPKHRPSLVHKAGEESMCLVVGDTLLVVDATVQGDVEAEGQKSHTSLLRVGCSAGLPLVDESLAAANAVSMRGFEMEAKPHLAVTGMVNWCYPHGITSILYDGV